MTLSEDELKEFAKFLRSPFFNKGRNFTPYFNILKRFYSKFDQKNLTKEYIFRKLRPGRNYDIRKAGSILSTLSSQLTGILEDYLVYKALEKKKIEKQFLVNDQLYFRGLFEQVEKNMHRIKTEVEKRGVDESYFRYHYIIYSKLTNSSLRLNKMKNYCEFVYKRSNYNFLHFFQDFFQMIAGFELFKEEFNFEPENSFYSILKNNLDLKKIFDEIESFNSYAGILQTYYLHMNSYNNFGDMNLYNRFKDSVYQNYEKFSYEEKFNFLTNLKAFLGISEKKVKLNLKKEKYKILNKMMKENMYGHTQGSKIYHSTFVNIVLMLLDQKKISEAEEFIKQFSVKLEEQVRENVLNEAYAWLNFHKKNFKESLKYVIKINDEMFNLKYRSRLLEIMCLYELKEYDQLEYSIKAAQKYLNENKSVSKAFHDRLYEFTGILQQLAVHEPDGEKGFMPDKILNSIKENQFLFMKEWVLQKLNEKRTLT